MVMMKRISLVFALLSCLSIQSASASSADQISTAFSPNAGALELVLETINGAETSIEMSAYVYTSVPITKALIAAQKRGVLVRVVLDRKGSNVRNARAALNALALAGVQVRVNGNFAIHHDKFMVVDDKTVETGSFNYTLSAASKNSENVIVIKDNPTLAKSFSAHWQSRYDAGEPYVTDLSGKFDAE